MKKITFDMLRMIEKQGYSYILLVKGKDEEILFWKERLFKIIFGVLSSDDCDYRFIDFGNIMLGDDNTPHLGFNTAVLKDNLSEDAFLEAVSYVQSEVEKEQQTNLQQIQKFVNHQQIIQTYVFINNYSVQKSFTAERRD